MIGGERNVLAKSEKSMKGLLSKIERGFFLEVKRTKQDKKQCYFKVSDKYFSKCVSTLSARVRARLILPANPEVNFKKFEIQ